MKRPERVLGGKVEGSLESYLAKAEEREQKKPQEEPVVVEEPKLDLSKYIILPGKTHGTYSYPDILVPMEKRMCTGKTLPAIYYTLKEDEEFLLTLRQFVDFIEVLKSQFVSDGNGNTLNQNVKSDLLNDIIGVKGGDTRSEWLDPFFMVNENSYQKTVDIHYTAIENGNIIRKMEIVPELSKQGFIGGLKNMLKVNFDPLRRISLDYWLQNATRRYIDH